MSEILNRYISLEILLKYLLFIYKSIGLSQLLCQCINNKTIPTIQNEPDVDPSRCLRIIGNVNSKTGMLKGNVVKCY